MIDGVTGFTEPLRVEARRPIFRGGRPPNLDCLLEGPVVVAGIESKLTEPLARHQATPWRPAYARPACRALLEEGWLATLDAALVGTYRPTHLDAAQLIKHALGLSKQNSGRELHLFYVYWEPDNASTIEEVLTHRAEIADLLDRVGNASPRLHALSYAQLWEQWDALKGVLWLPAHLAALRRRYALSLTGDNQPLAPRA